MAGQDKKAKTFSLFSKLLNAACVVVGGIFMFHSAIPHSIRFNVNVSYIGLYVCAEIPSVRDSEFG